MLFRCGSENKLYRTGNLWREACFSTIGAGIGEQQEEEEVVVVVVVVVVVGEGEAVCIIHKITHIMRSLSPTWGIHLRRVHQTQIRFIASTKRDIWKRQVEKAGSLGPHFNLLAAAVWLNHMFIEATEEISRSTFEFKSSRVTALLRWRNCGGREPAAGMELSSRPGHGDPGVGCVRSPRKHLLQMFMSSGDPAFMPPARAE
ncbi:unnamed protein product [Arctogadus glacialis]